MANPNPNPFRQAPPDDNARPEGSHSFFDDPKFEVTRSKVDFKEPLITSLPRTFSRLTRRKVTVVDKSLVRRRQTVATNRKAISILTMLLVVLGGIWGSLEYGKSGRPTKRLTRQEKKLNLKRQSAENLKEDARPAAVNKPSRQTSTSTAVSAAKVALRALALPSMENLEQTEAPKPQTQQEEPKAKTLFVTSPLLRIRSKPGLDGSIVSVLKAGDAVEVVGEDGSWAKIGEGQYVGKRHLTTTKPTFVEKTKPSTDKKQVKAPVEKAVAVTPAKAEKVAPKPAAPKPAVAASVAKHVAVQSVKIRGAPGPKRNVVGILRKGTLVSIYELRGVWARIGDGQFVHVGNLRPDSMSPVTGAASR